MTLEDLINLVKDFINKFRRHNHNGVETDKLGSDSFKGEGTAGQVLTSNGPDSSPSFQDGSSGVAGRMYLTGAFSINDANLKKVDFNNSTFATGITYNAGTFTVVTEGYYNIFSQIIFDNITVDAVMRFTIAIDGDPSLGGTLIADNQIEASGNGAFNIIQGGTVQDTVFLTVGQTVEIWIYKHYPAAGDAIVTPGTQYTFCTIHKI